MTILLILGRDIIHNYHATHKYFGTKLGLLKSYLVENIHVKHDNDLQKL